MLLLQPAFMSLPPNPNGSFALIEKHKIGDKIVALAVISVAKFLK